MEEKRAVERPGSKWYYGGEEGCIESYVFAILWRRPVVEGLGS